MRLLFFLLFIIIPVIEIYLFIKVGAIIGAGNTILIIFVTAIIGAGMLRSQGLQTLAKIQNSLNQFQLPARELVEGVLIVIGGAFLLTPGFFTDTIGFLFLIPWTRTWLAQQAIRIFSASFTVRTSRPDGFTSNDNHRDRNTSSRIIEGEFTEEKHSDDPRHSRLK